MNKAGTAIVFPKWVKGPTECKTRTFSVVLPDATVHGAAKIVQAFPNRPKNAKDRRGHAIARVLYTWLHRETEDQEAMAKDIESLASLGHTDRWKAAVRTWAHIARTDPEMFHQHATYANYAAD